MAEESARGLDLTPARPVRLRADVSGVPRYVPGRAAPSALVDKLSSNENPFPPHAARLGHRGN
ncbi:hypothetical protein [Streptomyces sp. NPDC127108]|uniref:hypothetical protein n=1 Tax=Streptomyces sp. NPDC127108 TaxID=3345361 RepID=UPI003640F3B8